LMKLGGVSLLEKSLLRVLPKLPNGKAHDFLERLHYITYIIKNDRLKTDFWKLPNTIINQNR
jgi:hypothetical protein